jgi:nucleoside-diphosphate-sugar epimerase
MKKKIFLVTGGSGFIGSAIVNKLASQKNYEIIVFDNLSRKNRSFVKNKNIKYIFGDIRNLKHLNKCFKFNIDAIIHLAYINGTSSFYKIPCDILEVGTKGIINLLDLSIKNNIKEFYLASSSEVYHLPKKIPTDEEESIKIPDIHNPRYSYSGGKIISELFCIHYGKKYFNKMVIFRPHNVYGPNMGNEHVVPQLIEKIKNMGKKNILKIKGSGKETRAFIFIEDFADAFDLLLRKGKHLNIYNLGNSEQISINSLTKKILKILKLKAKIIKTKIAKGGTSKRCPNIKKILKIGYKKKYDLDLGLKKTIKWYYYGN